MTIHSDFKTTPITTIAERVAEILATAPPLTEAQVKRISAIFRANEASVRSAT